MKKACHDDIWTWDIKQRQQNAIHSFFNMQLKSGRGLHLHDVWKMPTLHWTCSRIDALFFITVVLPTIIFYGLFGFRFILELHL